MADDDVLGIALIFVAAIFILAVILGFVNSIESLLVSSGIPDQIAGQIGSFLFFGILLAIVWTGIKGVLS